jgi:tRNA pseudouridine55 synthase
LRSGLVLIDKPGGITSHGVVAKLRKQLGTRKIGHAGTLDPMATGLMILGVNRGTKLLQFLLGMDKGYTATIRLGQATTTDDAEGEVISSASASGLTLADLEPAIQKLSGEILQVPTQVSAIKVDGKRAYDLVRAGEQVELKARPVTISRFDVLGTPRVDGDFLDFEVAVDCSSGTYIRALARDLGAALGVGGHLTALRRTWIGPFALSSASALGDEPDLLSLAEVAQKIFSTAELSSTQRTDLIHGKRIDLDGAGLVAGLHQGELVAILEPVGKQYRSVTVFPEGVDG